jgi:hypothetical protein
VKALRELFELVWLVDVVRKGLIFGLIAIAINRAIGIATRLIAIAITTENTSSSAPDGHGASMARGSALGPAFVAWNEPVL